jgi:hypothetical protein
MVANSSPQVLPFPTLDVSRAHVDAQRSEPSRGVRWVLLWAAALAVLGWAAVILLAFGYQLAAEQRLSRAAAAGLREATCERATSRTVEQTIHRRLVERGYAGQRVSIALQRNGASVSGVVRPAAGDRLCVSLSVPTESVLPGWLQVVAPPGQPVAITVWADHQMAGYRSTH